MKLQPLVITEKILEKFHSRYIKNKINDCWEWQGADDGIKYYSMTIEYKTLLVHRLSYIIHFGKVPDGMLILHKCDNPLCVNPDHLFIGTHKDNTQDCIKKGRFNGGSKPGGRGGRALFNPEAIKKIHALVWKGMSFSEIGRLIGVSPMTISRVIKGKGAYKR